MLVTKIFVIKLASTKNFVYICYEIIRNSIKMTQLTTSELEILQILWKNSPLSVKEINDKLNEKRRTGYTTTLKIMQIMTDKGILDRETEGKKHLYYPLIKEDETQKVLLDKFLDKAFMGSAQKLIMKALGSYKASKEELDEIRALLNKIEKEK